MHRVERRASRCAWKLLACAAAVVFMAACLDGVQGYPQQQAPIISPYDMTQEQRLAEMNAMGAAGHADHRWTYELRPGCVLRVDLDGPQGPRPSSISPCWAAWWPSRPSVNAAVSAWSCSPATACSRHGPWCWKAPNGPTPAGPSCCCA
ncbi:hypothetical protein ACHFCA_13105 [Delftia tsuruhatensis]